MTSYPTHLSETWQARNGEAVEIRAIRPADAAIEQEFVRGLSAESKYLRFLDTMRELSPQLLKRFTDIDYSREMALIAVHFEAAHGTHEETQVGVARYVTNRDSRSCEFAVVVADAWQRQGLGSKLVQKLLECARAAGLETIEGQVLADNHRMLEMTKRLGFRAEIDPQDASLRRVWRRLAADA
jgi:acetyltransferase